MPRLPKHESTRARRNKTAGARTLTAVHDVEAPELPDLSSDDGEWEWHPMTVRWWDDTWSSPMAPEFDGSDLHGLFVLAMLVDQFWTQPNAALAGEIRLQRQCFGLTPIDRRRLQWEIERGDAADRRNQQQRERDRVALAQQSGPPPKSAKKAQWLEWVALTRPDVDPAELGKLKKEQIIDRYGGEPTGPAAVPDPLDALTG